MNDKQKEYSQTSLIFRPNDWRAGTVSDPQLQFHTDFIVELSEIVSTENWFAALKRAKEKSILRGGK